MKLMRPKAVPFLGHPVCPNPGFGVWKHRRQKRGFRFEFVICSAEQHR